MLSLLAPLTLGCDDGNGAPPAPELPGAPDAGEWIEIEPGGETICARGTPYRFFVRGGRPDRVIIDFQGGGACWNALTCSLGDSLFSDSTGSLEEFIPAIEDGRLGGLFDPDPSSPFSDWTIVHIPYCTGDIHWGDATKVYGAGLSIEHRGFVNASTTLEWVYDRYPDPSSVFVTGCSAGAYGAALHSAYIGQRYPDAAMSVLADSGAGIITDTFLRDSLPNWNAEANLPAFIPGLDRPIDELSLPDVYRSIGAYYPEHRFAQTSAAFDADQIFFYEAMGGMPADWPGLFRASLDEISAGTDNFTAYVAPGSVHCVTPYPFFDTREVAGQNLASWAEQLAVGETMPEPAVCEGAECCDDPVCAACAAGEEGSWCRFCDGWPPAFSGCAATP